MKNRYAHLADGTRVRVKHTPFPANPSDLPSNPKNGDLVQVIDFGGKYIPLMPAQPRRRWFIVRTGGDGKLWLVKLRRHEIPAFSLPRFPT